ncbi:MAG: hypothetical protein AAF752_00050 [Bacteroidota bacterium]
MTASPAPEPTDGFEALLEGGHPNSLGRTAEVVEFVLADQRRLAELFACYFSSDPVVRLRTSNAMKRICAKQPECLLPYLSRMLTEVAHIDQAPAQWTLAQLFAKLEAGMTPAQRAAATEILKRNLSQHTDWIVLTQTMQTLAGWAAHDGALNTWLRPHLNRLSKDPRKSVAGRARRLLDRKT